ISPDVARNFSAASRVTHHGDVLEIQGLDHGCQIIGIPVHVVSGPSLAGSSVPTTIVSHDSEAVLCEQQQLTVPHIGIQWPSVREGDDWALAPVLVVDCRAVFRSDRAHIMCLLNDVPRAVACAIWLRLTCWRLRECTRWSNTTSSFSVWAISLTIRHLAGMGLCRPC